MPTDMPRVTILLATYNGAAHLAEQLRSYVAQQGVAWDLWVSDDGSEDATPEILRAFQRDHGTSRDIRLLDGPRQGAVANFMSLLTHPDLPTDRPVALSDQDDVWHPEKLARALGRLAETGPVTLYSGQSYHTDAALTVTGLSKPPVRPPGFRNALLQNVVSGHSMVMDAGALAIVRAAGLPADVPYHDWWLYQLISGAGGHIHVDTARMVHYRQHGTNTMGAHEGGRAAVLRLVQVMAKTYGDWIAANMAALTQVDHLLTEENRAVLRAIAASPPGPARAMAIRRQGLYRQSLATTACVYLAAVLRRL